MVAEWWLNNGITVAFYVLVILLLIIYRKKFEFQGIAALRKTKFGIAWMQKFSKKHKETIKIFAYCGIGIGFAGMLFIFGYVFKALYDFFFSPSAPAAFSLVLPGVNVPGAAIFIPLWVLIPLFIVVVIHEAGHGIVSKAFGVPIKTTGLVFFGPLAGAFVEPDEKKLEKKSDVVRFSVFAAGPFANALTGGIVLLLMLLVINPLTTSMVEPVGFSFQNAQEGMPAELAGAEAGVIYTMINGEEVLTVDQLTAQLQSVNPGEEVTLSNDEIAYTIVATEHPQDASKGYLGIQGIATDFNVKPGVPQWIYYGLQGLFQFFFWFFTLSLGLGAFNLLPLGPVDGGQMIRLAFVRMFGEKKGKVYWAKLGWFLLVIILILILGPILMSL